MDRLLIGLGKIEFDIDRKVSSSFNNGSRDGKQIFSSFKYTKKPKKNLKKIFLYILNLI